MRSRTEPGKGIWQDGWEEELREDFRARRPREGDTWGTAKDQKEALIAVNISANTERPSGVRQQGCNEKFQEDRQTESA